VERRGCETRTQELEMAVGEAVEIRGERAVEMKLW
jgi:hypothetical protein